MQNARRTQHAADYGIYVEYIWHKMLTALDSQQLKNFQRFC